MKVIIEVEDYVADIIKEHEQIYLKYMELHNGYVPCRDTILYVALMSDIDIMLKEMQ